MVKPRAFSPASERSDFTAETRDVVLSYFSLLPVQTQERILGGSLNLNSTNSSLTQTFRGDLLIAGRLSKESLIGSPEFLAINSLQEDEVILCQMKHITQSKDSDSDETDEIDYADSGRTRKKRKQQTRHRFGRSISYDEYNLSKKSQQGSLELVDNKGKRSVSPRHLLSEPKPAFNRARSASPARPTTLNIIPVYPSPLSLDLQNIQPGNGQKIKSNRKLSKVDSLEKRDASKDESRNLNFDEVHSGLRRQLSNKAQSERKAPISRSARTSLQNSQTNSTDRSSQNSDVSTSKTRSSRNSDSVMSVLDCEDDEVMKLVEDNIVNPLALSLKHAIEETIAEDPLKEESITRSPARSRPSDFSKRLSGSLNNKITRSPGARCTTPQSEVARLIAAIGDQIQLEYGHILNQAISTAVAMPEDRIDPETLEEIINREGLMSREHGWKKTVMVLAFCKGLALAMLSKNRSISRLLDSTVEMLADSFADFVIRQGGWTGILSADVTPASLLTPVSSNADGVEKFPPDWDELTEPESSHQVDGQENNDEEYGAVGGTIVSESKNQNSVNGSPPSPGRRNSDNLDEKNLERVRMEIWLMRQISEQYNEENQHRGQWSRFSKAALTIISLTLAGGALVLFLKRRERLGALLSFLRK